MKKSRLIIIISIFLFINSLALASALPDYFDWRDNNGDWMTAVKDQGDCGSCWAYAAVGTTEAQYNIAKNNAHYDLDLSEENLVSNCSSAGDCNGGHHDQALGYIRDSGIVNESCFPYIDSSCPISCGCTYGCSDAICSDNQCTNPDDLYYIDDYTAVSSNKEDIKDWLVNVGPVAVDMNWSGGYWDGEIRRCIIDSGIDHSVVITGYNETEDYWIVRNSYGPGWGDDGYFKVGFDECLIQTQVYGVNLTEVSTQNLTVSNTGTANLVVSSITDNRAWITSISPTSFTVNPSSSQEVIVEVDPSGYSPGSYSGTISIYSNDPDENPKTVTVIMNVSKYEDGHSCSSDSDCQSNYCDNDGVGLSDDNWCFTPYNTYFDGQEPIWCEYSTDNGEIDCDERQVEWDIGKCVGISYYQDECTSTCGYQDITSVFECTDTDCSCNTPECDWVVPQGTIDYCDKGGQTYFQDDCGTNATAEDTNNICRSANSLQAGDGCTADSECNGVEAGTGGCNLTCNYDTTPPNITSVITINESGVVDGDALLGDNVTFNVTVTDEGSGVESVWLKIWEGVVDVSNVIWQGFLSFVTGDLWSVEVETNESFPVGDVNYTVYANDSLGNEANVSGDFTVVAPPNDTYKFYIKDSVGNNVAWLGNEGNIILKGSCYFGGNCDSPGDGSLIFRNSSLDYVAFINSTGDLCLESGDCSDQSADCDSPGDGSFIIRNSSLDYVSYINATGDLCLIGGLYENADL